MIDLRLLKKFKVWPIGSKVGLETLKLPPEVIKTLGASILIIKNRPKMTLFDLFAYGPVGPTLLPHPLDIRRPSSGGAMAGKGVSPGNGAFAWALW